MSITVSDFTKAIQSLHDVWNNVADIGGPGWQYVTILRTQAFNAVPYLRLAKRIPNSTLPTGTPTVPGPDPDPELPVEESDPEALSHPLLQLRQEEESILIIYDIVYSLTYLVPILYITLSPLVPSADSLYALLVPQLYKSSLSSPAIGVLGALSATTHPETGRRCCWIHPCLSQEGMEGLGLKGEDGVGYLMGWIGIMGGGAGLELPFEVARAVWEGTDRKESLDEC